MAGVIEYYQKSLYILGSFIFDDHDHLKAIAKNYEPFAKDDKKRPTLTSLRQMAMRAEKPKKDRFGRMRVAWLKPWSGTGQRPTGNLCFTPEIMARFFAK